MTIQNMKVLFKIFFLLLFAPFLVAQTGSVSGKIVEGDQVISFVNIAVAGSSLGATSDEEGYFTIKNIPVGQQELLISMLGYRTINKKVDIIANQEASVGVVELQEDVFGLEEVVVTGTMKESFITNSPVKIEVITARFLEKNTAPTNIVEGVTLVNGVQEVVACGVCYTNSISINGLPGAYTAVLMDGAPIYGNLASVYGLKPPSLIVLK